MPSVPRSLHTLHSIYVRRTVVGGSALSQVDSAGVVSSPITVRRAAAPTRQWVALFAGFWVLAVGVVASPVAAHTGPGTRSGIEGFLHPLGGIDHLLAMVVVGVLAALATNRWVAWSTPLVFVAGMVGGAGLGLAGVPLPGVEVAIAISVIALGVLLGGIVGEFGSWLPPVVAVFGAVHGYAHGAELPSGAVPVLYITGFVAATAALHVLGAGLGRGIRNTEWVRAAVSAAVSAAGAAILISL